MEAKVTLTMNAAEFDLLRGSLTANWKAACEVVSDKETPAPARAAARAEATQLKALLEKLT